MASLVGKAKGFVTEKIAQMPKPEASLERVSFKSISREGVALHSHVDVSNPYSYRIPICELTYTFKSDGKFVRSIILHGHRSIIFGHSLICHGFSRDSSVIASGTMPDPGWIGASGTTKLELPVNVPYDFVMSLMKDLSGDWDIDYVLEVGITIDLPVIGTFTIPVSTEGEMKLPTFRDLF